ncbi:MAG: DUF3473 domain-containing protein [Pirellulaceae bacterium]|nr:DUF3473 domain-containing protein [Pirellulaceae bacterium]
MRANVRPASRGLNAFTVDVEDYFQVTSFERQIDRADWDQFPSRVAPPTRQLLELLARHETRGTFYVLGWVAERHPELVREIAAAGHEIGSHSYWHRLVYGLTPDEFREDLRRSRDVLQQITGQPVVTYRAPTFSITRRSLWALEILVEEGFTVDSSIFPVFHDRYGIAGAPRGIYRIQTPAGPLWQFPPTVVRLARQNFPVAGGGYFRLYPYRFTRYCLARRQHEPFMFYTHPWEIDAGQPRLVAGSRLSRFRHYVHLDRTLDKLERLVRGFAFGAVEDVLVERGESAPVYRIRQGELVHA